MFFHKTDGRMIPYLGPDFVRALLGLDACDGPAEASLDLDSAEPLMRASKMRAQSNDCRYTAERITSNNDKQSSLPESKREIGRATAKKDALSESTDADINPCGFSDSEGFVMTPSDSTERETLTTPLRGRFVVFSLWDRLVYWLNKHTGTRER